MPIHHLPITTIIATLDNDTCFAEALFFAELLRYSDQESQAIEAVKANVKKLAEETPLLALHRRHPAGEPVIGELSLTLNPPERSSAKFSNWRTPVELKFKYVGWLHGDAAAIAYIPALNIEVCSTKTATIEAVEQMAISHIRAELSRRGALSSLEKLALLQRTRELKVVSDSIEITLHTPKQMAAREEHREDRKKSALAEAATDLTEESLPAAFEMEETVAQIAEALTGRSPQSVLLVGRAGVGKTAAVYELVRGRERFQLAHTPFYSTNGSRLVAGMSGFGQWQERCTKLWHEAASARAILCLGNLIELMEVGKSVGNTQGIADFLRPYIARGDVLAIAECTPEQLSVIERTSPRMLDAFHQFKIEEPSVDRSRNVLLSVALALGKEGEVQLDAIERIDQLHRRYATYSAFPGRPVRFLKNLLQDHPSNQSLTTEDVTSAFSRETGLPRVLLEETEPLDLEATHKWFASRVVGQSEAVDLIVDLLATVKAGLVRPRKPIASLLFIGPTGVGKTEMAKSLAEFLFRDPSRMIRFDMSEYADPLAVQRLIGSVHGKEGLLTAKVREQPFAVVLLDEFEKADPSFFDLLLQVLGEGRLTDAMGRVADFSNAVVVMTSNLGAQSFGRGIYGFGETKANREAASKHFTKAVRDHLRPEMFNRIDRIVPFAPLIEETVLKIAEREIELIRMRDGIRYRKLNLQIGDGVVKFLAHRGYDARYGARPLKRAIERELLVPLAEELNQQPVHDPVKVTISVEEGKLKIDALRATGQKTLVATPTDHSLVSLAFRWSSLRREWQMLERSSIARNLQNETFTLERLEKKLEKSKWKNPDELERLARLPVLKDLSKEIMSIGMSITKGEERALLAVYGKGEAETSDPVAQVTVIESEWKNLLRRLYAFQFKKPDYITLAFFGEDGKRLFELARAYYQFAIRKDASITVCQFSVKSVNRSAKARKQKSDHTPLFDRLWIEKPNGYFDTPREEVLCLAIGISFPQAYPMLHLERGLHTFAAGKNLTRCLIETSETGPRTYLPPVEMTRPNAIGQQEKRRHYNQDQSLVDDHLLNLRAPWSGRITAELLEGLIEKSFLAKATALMQ